MTKYAAITSMDINYYNHCGKAMLGSYKKYWEGLLPLHVYNEDEFDIKVKTIQLAGWDLGDNYANFQNRHTNAKVKTFAKKGFSIIHAMKHQPCDRLIWLDADTIIRQSMPRQLLELMTPADVLSTHFSVWHAQGEELYHSCETGFFILNKTHPGYDEFCKTYEDIYVNDKSTDLRRFYDGEVYGKTVELMQNKGHKMLNLNPGKHKTPIGRSILAPYISHFKAGLKDKVDFDKIQSDNEL